MESDHHPEEITMTKEEFDRLQTSPNIIVVVDPMFSSDIAIEEGVCTFKYTRNRYSFQKWFQCLTCSIYCCIICTKSCHMDHSLSEESETDFFCDCGAENKLCKSMN